MNKGLYIIIICLCCVSIIFSILGFVLLNRDSAAPAYAETTVIPADNQNIQGYQNVPQVQNGSQNTTQVNQAAEIDNNVNPGSKQVAGQDGNAALSSDEDFISFFNSSVNNLKSGKYSFTKSKNTETADIKLSNSVANKFVDAAKSSLLSNDTNNVSISKGDVNTAISDVSPSGKQYVSNLSLSDVSSVSHSSDNNGNYDILIKMPDVKNPDANSAYSKIFDFMTVDDVVNIYAPKMHAKVDRENISVNFTDCYAEAVISPDGTLLSYKTFVQAEMALKDASISVISTDVNVMLKSTTTYSDIS